MRWDDFEVVEGERSLGAGVEEGEEIEEEGSEEEGTLG